MGIVVVLCHADSNVEHKKTCEDSDWLCFWSSSLVCRARTLIGSVSDSCARRGLRLALFLEQRKTAVQKSKEVQWIPLPEKDFLKIEPKTLCSVAGWGYTETNGHVSSRLLEVNMSVVDKAVCQNKWIGISKMMCVGGSVDNRGFCKVYFVIFLVSIKIIALRYRKRLLPNGYAGKDAYLIVKGHAMLWPEQSAKKRWRNEDITPRMMCAGGNADKRGFCQGDSGGPLVCSGLAVGIVSFNYNYNCTYPSLPNVYTQISKFLPWVKKYINNTSLSFLKR
ncbi:uncharacterized protein LOC118225194 [Anguilla anguilla]|uniref:uncharacterized protein LOC118225194 n=1 Tax=Anguilla anguilla TaxID=7936 RepID=UPI0015ADFDEF|nr:uncharacterized protein LOC118225194 [Anguilla anguilla]